MAKIANYSHRYGVSVENLLDVLDHFCERGYEVIGYESSTCTFELLKENGGSEFCDFISLSVLETLSFPPLKTSLKVSSND